LLAGSLLIRAAQRLSVYLLETFAMPGEHLWVCKTGKNPGINNRWLEEVD
jgi:hypothetical protein